MKVRLLLVGGAIVGMALAGGLSMTVQGAGSAPTFNKDIAPIIFNNCVACHRPNQVAPMTLMSYKEVRPWARSIKNKISKGEMPPWYADARFGEFRNDRRLTPEQVKTIIDWVDTGAPEGDTPLAAKLPDFKDGWTHPSGRPPDLVIEMVEPFVVQAEGELPGFTVYQELPEVLRAKEHYIEAIQVLPGVVPVVHHAGFNIKLLPPGKKVGVGEAWPGGPIISGALIDSSTGKSVSTAGDDANENSGVRTSAEDLAELRFCCYVPGGTFQRYPAGAGKRINPKGVIGWQMHYTAVGRPVADRTRVGLWFQNEMTHEIIFTGGTAHQHIINGRELVDDDFTPIKGSRTDSAVAVPAVPVIPPYTKDFSITGFRVFQDDVTLYIVWPHMHLRGKAMTYRLTYPDGRERVVMSAPKYDFNWQIFYEFKEPIKIPAGSVMKTIGSMDNSPANRWNPAPQKEVYWSEQSWDEMFIGVMELSVDKFDLRETKTAKPFSRKSGLSVGGGD